VALAATLPEMILYNNYSGASQVLFIFSLRGSVFPFAFLIALPSALLSMALKVSCTQEYLDGWSCLTLLSASGGTAAWSGFTFLVGFVIVFRTSQAYTRFWEALADTHSMLAEWFDAVSSIVAFTRCSQAADKDLESETFLHTIVRVFSMLSASALQDLSDVGSHQVWGLEVLDPGAIDDVSISTLDGSMCRVELIYSWIQQLTVGKMAEGIVDVPAPLASRIFAELASGMAKYQDARKHSRVPFPFPYAQTTMTLLLFHWILTPLVMIQWSDWVAGSAIFTFVQVFTLWSMNAMATQFERPFGSDANCIDALEMQELFNKKLVLLMSPRTRRIPCLDPSTFLDIEVLRKRERIHAAALKREGWELRHVGRSRADWSGKTSGWRRCGKICRCCRQAEEKDGQPQVAVSTRYSVKRYGIVDGQRTAVLTIGIFKDELVVAVPTIDEDRKDLVEVLNVHGEACSLSMKRIPIQQRHKLIKAPPEDWETDFVDFPSTYAFRAEVLVHAFHDLGRKVELVTVCEEGEDFKDDSDSDKSSEGVAERLGAVSTLRRDGKSSRGDYTSQLGTRETSGRISEGLTPHRGSHGSLLSLPGATTSEDQSAELPGQEVLSKQKSRFLSAVPNGEAFGGGTQRVGQIATGNSGLVATPSSPAVAGAWAAARAAGMAMRLRNLAGADADDQESSRETSGLTWGTDFVVGIGHTPTEVALAVDTVVDADPHDAPEQNPASVAGVEALDEKAPPETEVRRKRPSSGSSPASRLDDMVSLVISCTKDDSDGREVPRGFSELPT